MGLFDMQHGPTLHIRHVGGSVDCVVALSGSFGRKSQFPDYSCSDWAASSKKIGTPCPNDAELKYACGFP